MICPICNGWGMYDLPNPQNPPDVFECGFCKGRGEIRPDPVDFPEFDGKTPPQEYHSMNAND